METCSVKECEKEAPAILGLYHVCGQHYDEWYNAHINEHRGNEWFDENIERR